MTPSLHSQNKIDGCTVDILFPTPYWLGMTSLAGSDRPWHERMKRPVVWRGTTTGTSLDMGTVLGFDWRKGHRIRLATQFADATFVDAKVV